MQANTPRGFDDMLDAAFGPATPETEALIAASIAVHAMSPADRRRLSAAMAVMSPITRPAGFAEQPVSAGAVTR